jgi:hypothetical protein
MKEQRKFNIFIVFVFLLLFQFSGGEEMLPLHFDMTETTIIEAENPHLVKRYGDWVLKAYPDTSPLRGIFCRYLALISGEGSLEFSFTGRSLSILLLSTWEFPGPMNGCVDFSGKVTVTVDGEKIKEVKTENCSQEVLIKNDLSPGEHQVKVEAQAAPNGWVMIDKFRVGNFSFGSIKFNIQAEEAYFLNDLRAVLIKDGEKYLSKIIGNGISGECLLTGLRAGRYDLSVSAKGWENLEIKGIEVKEGEEKNLGEFFLKRKKRCQRISKILYPIRNNIKFIKPGEVFTIDTRFEKNEISNVYLKTKYFRQSLAIKKIEDLGEVRRIFVQVPPDSPYDFYDLLVNDEISPQSVRVYKEFPEKFYLVSFGHLDIWGQEPAEWLSCLGEIINLINPEFVLIANEMNWAYVSGALSHLQVPYFITTGNHSYPDFEDYYGERISYFDYGRIRCVNYGLLNWSLEGRNKVKEIFSNCPPEIQFRIINAYEYTSSMIDLLNECRVNLIHEAHGEEGQKKMDVGTTPTRRLGKINRESFRLIKIEGNKIVKDTYNNHPVEALPFPRVGKIPLTIQFTPANDGTNKIIEAKINNSWEEVFEKAKIRFYLPKGKYKVSKGEIFQTFDATEKEMTIVDVKINIPARSICQVVIMPEE